MVDAQTQYLMFRSREEAVRAIQSSHPSAAAAHSDLSRRYTELVVTVLKDGDAGEGGDA